MRKLIYVLAFVLMNFCFLSCGEDKLEDSVVGVWQLSEILHNDSPIDLTEAEKSVKLLIEPNGVYRSTQKNSYVANENYFGAWSITDQKWMELSCDLWKLSLNPLGATNASDQWIRMHLPIRLTILKLNDHEMELRLRSFIGDVKYAVLFTEPNIPFITKENLPEVQSEFKTLRTHVFKFKK